MAKNIAELKTETGIQEFDAILKVKENLRFSLAGGEGDEEHRLTDRRGIWIGPFAEFRRIPIGVYGITHWNDSGGDPIIHGLLDDGPECFDQEEILSLVNTHRVAAWLQAPPDE